LAGGLSLALAVVVGFLRGATGHRSFAVVLAGTAVWSLGSGLEIVAPTVASKIFWIRIQYIGVAFLPPSWLAFALEYSGRARLVPRRLLGALYLLPAVTWALVLTSPRHAWMWQSVGLPPAGFGELATDRGLWFWAVHVPYSWSLVVAGMALLLLPGAEGAARDRPRRLIGLAALPPFLANAAYVLGGSRFVPGDFTPLGFAVTGARPNSRSRARPQATMAPVTAKPSGVKSPGTKRLPPRT